MSSSQQQAEKKEAIEEEEKRAWYSIWLRGYVSGTGGSLSEVTWIGRDVLAWCSGLHLVFFDVPSNKLLLPRLPNDAIASGASCLAGHLRHKVFAFADKNIKPRIHIYTYPSMTQISMCHKGTSFQYLSIVFSGDLLISLGSVIAFRLNIWLWRTGEKIGSVHTSIYDADAQILKVNYTTPLFIAQIGNKSGRLMIWETTICATTVHFNKHEIFLPKKAIVKDVAWNPESRDVLAITDLDGHIYLCDSVGNNLKRIVLSQRCDSCAVIEPTAICWYRDGIILRTTFCQIRYYRKDATDFWRKMWLTKLTTHPRALTSHPYRNDRVFFTTSEGHLVQMIFSDDLSELPTMNEKYFVGGKYRFIDFIHPWDEHIAAMDDSEELSIIQTDVGVEISKVNLEIKGRVMAMLSHPEHPFVVVCSDSGEVVFVNIIDCKKPKILGKYWMQSDALDLMKFSNSGRFLAICQKKIGLCYFFDVSCKSEINIITRVDTASTIADILMFDTVNGLKFCVLQSLSTIPKFGNKLSIYLLPLGASEFRNTNKVFCFLNYYQQLHCIPNEMNAFVGMPYLTKKLTYFKINDWKSLNLQDVIISGHYARQVSLYVCTKWLVTTSIDGLVIIKNLASKKSKNMRVVTHHRCDMGVSKAIINTNGDLIVARGADGSLVAVKHRASIVNADSDKRYQNLHEFGTVYVDNNEFTTNENIKLSKEVVDALSQPIRFFAGDVTWTTWQEQQKIDEEKKLFATEREAIVKDFSVLKSRIIDLLDKNETCSELNKLPISTFALDRLFRERKIKEVKDEREEIMRELESDILERDRVSSWIRNKFWDSQDILAQSIFGIFEDVEVTNYAVTKKKDDDAGLFEFARFSRSVTAELTSEDNIYPWNSYEDDKLKIEYEKQSKVKKNSVKEIIFDEEENLENEKMELKHFKELYEGLTTHRFIEPCAPYYSQYKAYAYSQFLHDNFLVTKDTARLRIYFNQQFSDIHSVKEREMNLVRERVDRVLFIISELEFMFEESVSTKLSYPEWHMKEKPESIIKVKDEELKARPYISASYQEMLNKQAAEEERARLARLADDFRELALKAMMDGVLEVRWEDIIKREPGKPECMLMEKKPADYTDEDQLAIKKYEQELNNLMIQRQKYRKILQTDYTKVNNLLQESMERFNSRLEGFHLLKIKVESAIQQLNLRYVRHLAKHMYRLNELKKVDDIKLKIQKNYQELASIEEEVQVVKNVEQEQLVIYENLHFKDKLMEKKLQNEFSGLGKNALGALYSLYKKRPRNTLKATSAYEGLDLGISIKSMETLPYLTSESFDYLKQLDTLDIRPATLSQSVENSHWKNLVALRRLKIDHELKLRAVTLNLDAIAMTLSNLSQKQSELKTSIESMTNYLSDSAADRIENDLNIEIQLVLKMGQMEDEPLRGSLTQDLQNAIIVPQQDINQVNEAIIACGRRKIQEIERNLEFSRGIKFEEWEHRCLKTKMNHRSVMLHYVKLANVTREIREYLKRKKIGQSDEKTAQKLQKDVDAKRNNLEKLVKEWEEKLHGVSNEVLRIQQKNTILDKKIIKLNVERCSLELSRDYKIEAMQKEFKNTIVKIFAERSAIVRKLLENYEQISVMKEKMKCMNGKDQLTTFSYEYLDFEQ